MVRDKNGRFKKEGIEKLEVNDFQEWDVRELAYKVNKLIDSLNAQKKEQEEWNEDCNSEIEEIWEKIDNWEEKTKYTWTSTDSVSEGDLDDVDKLGKELYKQNKLINDINSRNEKGKEKCNCSQYNNPTGLHEASCGVFGYGTQENKEKGKEKWVQELDDIFEDIYSYSGEMLRDDKLFEDVLWFIKHKFIHKDKIISLIPTVGKIVLVKDIVALLKEEK